MPKPSLAQSVKDSTSLVGVIDLKNGAAVHAVQGKRDRYKPVGVCLGDPLLLLDHYASSGIRRFYVADLDAITTDHSNANLIQNLAKACEAMGDCIEIAFDLGWRGINRTRTRKIIQQLSGQFRRCKWIAATEAMPNPTAVGELAQLVGSDCTILSLDYQNGKLLGENYNENAWLKAAINANINQFLVLDLASVGSNRGPTTVAQCQETIAIVSKLKPHHDAQIYSGGGVRSSQDVDTLLNAGCNRIMLATALHPDAEQNS